MLRIAGIHASYGHIEALKGVDLEIEAGEIVALIGANGAGKSTLLMTVCGRPRAARGQIEFEGRDITRLETFQIVRLGIAQAPEGRRIFPRMTVLENLQMGATLADDAHFSDDLRRVFALFPILRQRQTQRGGTLSGGEQQMLAIGRALMMSPRLLVLDEPSFGLAPRVVEAIFGIVQRIRREQRVSVLLVEQNANLALEMADRAYLLETGYVVMSGSAKALADDPQIRRSYLGY
jgi:branched-chain amino acid transport system ATP-binding protein